MKKGSQEKINLAKARLRAKKQPDFGILAIDPATLTGVAYQTPKSPMKWELWDLNRKANESDGMKWLRFRAKIKELCQKHDIAVVSYERPSGQHQGAVIHHAKLAAVIEQICAELDIECKAYSAGAIKKFATGNGAAKKPDMILSAQVKLGYTGEDNNEADAIWLLQLTKSEI